jgi:hypothetical protein
VSPPPKRATSRSRSRSHSRSRSRSSSRDQPRTLCSLHTVMEHFPTCLGSYSYMFVLGLFCDRSS